MDFFSLARWTHGKQQSKQSQKLFKATSSPPVGICFQWSISDLGIYAQKQAGMRAFVKRKVSELQITLISSPDFQTEVKMEPKSLNITLTVFNLSMLESEGPLLGPTSNRLFKYMRRTPLRVDLLISLDPCVVFYLFSTCVSQLERSITRCDQLCHLVSLWYLRLKSALRVVLFVDQY